jgi:hypothetical protein
MYSIMYFARIHIDSLFWPLNFPPSQIKDLQHTIANQETKFKTEQVIISQMQTKMATLIAERDCLEQEVHMTWTRATREASEEAHRIRAQLHAAQGVNQMIASQIRSLEEVGAPFWSASGKCENCFIHLK